MQWPERLRPQEGGQEDWVRIRGRYCPLSRRGAHLRGILLVGIALHRRQIPVRQPLGPGPRSHRGGENEEPTMQDVFD